MRAVISRVLEAAVTADGKEAGRIAKGMLILLGISQRDTEREAEFLALKCCGLRIFEDDGGKMNLSASDIGGEILIVPNFTLCGDCRRGKRPDFTAAARPAQAEPLYEYFIDCCRKSGLKVQTGVFGADMKISQISDGPVTLVIDTKDSP